MPPLMGYDDLPEVGDDSGTAYTGFTTRQANELYDNSQTSRFRPTMKRSLMDPVDHKATAREVFSAFLHLSRSGSCPYQAQCAAMAFMGFMNST